MHTTFLKSLQPGARYTVISIARRLGLSRRATLTFLESLVKSQDIVRDVVVRPGNVESVYYSLPVETGQGGTQISTANCARRLSSRDVLSVMRAGTGYSASDLAVRLGVDIKRVHGWLPRLRGEGSICDASREGGPRMYFLSGTQPRGTVPTSALPAANRPARIVNGAMNVCGDYPFEREYGRELRRLAALSRLTR